MPMVTVSVAEVVMMVAEMGSVSVGAVPVVSSQLDGSSAHCCRLSSRATSSSENDSNVLHSSMGEQGPPMPTTYSLPTVSNLSMLPQVVRTSGPEVGRLSPDYICIQTKEKSCIVIKKIEIVMT